MYHITKDKRAQVSSKTLIDAYIKLVKEGQCDHITITSLCEYANIGRVTFYRHFDCLDDILKKVCDDKFNELANYLNKFSSPDQIFLEPWLQFWYTNIEIIELIFSINKDYIILESMRNIINTFEQKNTTTINTYLIEIKVSIFISIIKQWINDKLSPQPKELAAIISDQFKYILK